MFTGLIQALGRLAARTPIGGDVRLRFTVGTLPFEDVQLGESIACNGACLTVVAFDATPGGAYFDADVSTETLALTTFGTLPVGAAVNLEQIGRASCRERV